MDLIDGTGHVRHQLYERVQNRTIGNTLMERNTEERKSRKTIKSKQLLNPSASQTELEAKKTCTEDKRCVGINLWL